MGRLSMPTNYDIHKTLFENPDAKVWSQKFAEVAKDLYSIELDKEWLEVWFANAIMSGYDFSEKTKSGNQK
jgi:hypothetical protein